MNKEEFLYYHIVHLKVIIVPVELRLQSLLLRLISIIGDDIEQIKLDET